MAREIPPYLFRFFLTAFIQSNLKGKKKMSYSSFVRFYFANMHYYFIEEEVSIWMLFMNIFNEANIFISNFKTFCFLINKLKS